MVNIQEILPTASASAAAAGSSRFQAGLFGWQFGHLTVETKDKDYR